MVKNGYILNVSTKNIASFLDKVRLELKDVVREQVLMQTAKSTEWLYDMKFIEQRKYDAFLRPGNSENGLCKTHDHDSHDKGSSRQHAD